MEDAGLPTNKDMLLLEKLPVKIKKMWYIATPSWWSKSFAYVNLIYNVYSYTLVDCGFITSSSRKKGRDAWNTAIAFWVDATNGN